MQSLGETTREQNESVDYDNNALTWFDDMIYACKSIQNDFTINSKFVLCWNTQLFGI